RGGRAHSGKGVLHRAHADAKFRRDFDRAELRAAQIGVHQRLDLLAQGLAGLNGMVRVAHRKAEQIKENVGNALLPCRIAVALIALLPEREDEIVQKAAARRRPGNAARQGGIDIGQARLQPGARHFHHQKFVLPQVDAIGFVGAGQHEIAHAQFGHPPT
ncbi:hypothetical protein KXV85_005217, partial [Aspergillus fumigatus]